MPPPAIIRRFAKIFRRPRRRFLPPLFAALLFAAGCSYKSEIRQGNDTLPDKISELQTGMTRDEVRDLLGASRVPVVFAGGETIYYYRRRTPGFFPKTETLGIGLTFDGDVLAQIRQLPGAESAAEE